MSFYQGTWICWTCKLILQLNRENCPIPTMCSQGAVSVYFPSPPLLLITCSMSVCSDVSSLILYLARIFMMGLIFSHHCVFGMRCLQQTENQLLLSDTLLTRVCRLEDVQLTQNLCLPSVQPEAGR